MEHKQIEKCHKQKNALKLKKLIARLTQLKKSIA